MSTAAEGQLIEALRARRVAAVVGAGVSSATAGLPGWAGLIESGLRYAHQVGLLGADDLARGENALRESGFLDAANLLKAALGAPDGEYPRWLEHTFRLNRDRIRNRTLINSVVDLPCACFATTNFDHLLTLHHPDALPPATWTDAPAMQSAVQDGNRILHLHGSYDEPASVILGIDNYRSLAGAPAYEAIMRTLWLDRVLLFVGCSFDGLTDPDFRKLIDWASQTFRGTSHKHFALLRTGTFTADQVRQFLNDWRIQIVPFGETFDDLPIKLQALNPERPMAYARRVQRARDVLWGAEPEPARLADLLFSLSADSDARDAQMEAQARADQLLERHTEKYARARGDLRLLQAQAASMVRREDVGKQWQRWADGELRTGDSDFSETLLRASGAVYLFPESLLQELHRRGVPVHEAVVSNHVRQYVDHFASPSTYFHSDPYTLENAARVLLSWTALMDCDPDKVFPLPSPGTMLSRPHPVLLAICRHNRLELRSALGQVEAALPSSAMIWHASAHRLGGERVVVLADRHAVSAWNPLRATLPSAEFAVGGSFGIVDVDHREFAGTLRSVVTTIDGPVYLLENLQLTRAITDPEGRIDHVVMTRGGRIFGLGKGPGVHVRRYDDDHWEEVFTTEDLDQLLPRLPILNRLWSARLAEENGRLELNELGEWHTDDGRYQHPSLDRMTIAGEELLVLNVTLSLGTADDQIILLFDGIPPTPLLRGSYYRDGRVDRGIVVSDMDTALGPGGVGRMITARLSDFELGYDQIVVTRATPTRDGTAFMRELAFGRTHDDLISIAMIDDDRGFAADDSGGLFRFSLASEAFEEVDRDETSRIVSVRTLEWSDSR